MDKVVYSITDLKTLRCTVDDRQPPANITQSSAFDAESVKRTNSFSKRSNNSFSHGSRGLPPREDSFGSRDSFGGVGGSFGGGRRHREERGSPAITHWVYRTKGSEQCSGEKTWADIQTLIDDMLVEPDEIELHPVGENVSKEFMSYDDAVSYRSSHSGRQNSTSGGAPNSPGNEWRSSAGQRMNHGGHRNRLPPSPSFEARNNASTSSHPGGSHHSVSGGANSPNRSWTRDDMSKPQPVQALGALGAELDEFDLGIGSIDAPGVGFGAPPVGIVDIVSEQREVAAQRRVSGDEVSTPSKLAASTGSIDAPRPVMPPPPIMPLDIGSAEKKSLGDNNAPQEEFSHNNKDVEKPKSPAMNAWGVKASSADEAVDLGAIISEEPKAVDNKAAGGNNAANGKKAEWKGQDLPSLQDVGSGVSKRASKAQSKQHPVPAGTSDTFWEPNATSSTVSDADKFPSLDALGGSKVNKRKK